MKTKQDCDFKFYFSVKLNLKPKNWPEPVEKGLIGHDLLAVYFKTRLQGGTYEQGVDAVNEAVRELVIANMQRPVVLEAAKLVKQVFAFAAYVEKQPWKIIQVEENEEWLIEEDKSFGYTPDVIFEWTEGPKRGIPFVLDYKFTGQYWNDRQINTVQQMLKYLIYYNKKHGTKMRHAGVVMLNTRAGANDSGNKLFLLKWLPVSKDKLRTIEHENEVLVKRIEPFFHMTPEEFKAQAVHTPQELTCKMCWFADDLCPQDMNGQDIKNAIEANYEVNSYGYN
jgi:hypothetical protein